MDEGNSLAVRVPKLVFGPSQRPQHRSLAWAERWLLVAHPSDFRAVVQIRWNSRFMASWGRRLDPARRLQEQVQEKCRRTSRQHRPQLRPLVPVMGRGD